jgi:energy-converting hydrogenase B subunit D
MAEWTLDIMLSAGLIILAWRAVVTPHLFRAVVLFITFGLLLALSWVRLDAPDIALAEAAIGAGLTGVLLLDAYGYMERTAEDVSSKADELSPE